MPSRPAVESRRPLRPSARGNAATAFSSGGASSSSGGSSSAGSSSSSMPSPAAPPPSSTSRPALGPPDVYPQDPSQKEDELSAVHVKQGFTQSYSAHVSDEYGTAATRNAVQLTLGKVLGELRCVQSRKEEASVLPDSSGRRRQPVNTKDHFWLVTGRNKAAVDGWFRDLKGCQRPLSWLSRRVPVFNKREEVLSGLCEHEVPLARAVWFIKMTAAHASAMQETNKTKKRQMTDPSLDWTSTIVRFLKDQLAEINNLVGSSSSSSMSHGLGGEETKPENSVYCRYWFYMTKLCELMYNQGLLDRQEFLQWLLDAMEKYRYPDDPVLKLLLPLVLQYTDEFVKSELLSRKMAYQCSKKITMLVNDTDAINAPDNSESAPGSAAGANSPHPVVSAFVELLDDPNTRFVVLGLSAVLQTITLECPTALVWYHFGDNKTPSSLNGSPLDHMPNCAPSGLPMPPRQHNQALRHRIKQAELAIKERSMAAEAKWSGDHLSFADKNVNLVLSILEDLDSHVFERLDSSSNSLDGLYSRLFSNSNSGNEESESTVVLTLCEWAVTSRRSGEHRAFVVAKLLERRQAEMTSGQDSNTGDDEDNASFAGTPYFQSALFRYLDLEAPTIERKKEFGNLALLFYELISHDVFSHDSYLCQLISRGDINQPLGKGGEDRSTSVTGTGDDADGSFEDSKINDDLTNLLNQIKEGNQLEGGPAFSPPPPPSKNPCSWLDVSKCPRHMQYCYHFPLPPDESSSHDCNQRHVMLYGVGKGKDEASKSVKKLFKDIMKLFSKKCSIDVSDGGKVKKNSKHDFLFENVVQRFQRFSFFDQHTVTQQCGATVVEMLAAFSSGSANYLPVAEYVSFLMDLAGIALNIRAIIEWSMQILKELPGVESQLIERGSCLTRNYTTTLALFVVGVLRRYHSVVIVQNAADVVTIFEQLSKVAYKPKLPNGDSGSSSTAKMLDCNSAEWCILAYLYDLCCACPALKARDKFPELRRLFGHNAEPSLSNLVLTDRKFGIDYLVNPRKQVDPLIIKHLIESPQNQYNLVCNVVMKVCECNDIDKLNDIAILCCEFTSQCNSLSSEWLGAFAALSNAGGTNGYPDLLSQVSVSDQSIYNRLGTFASILIARHCFQLQAFVITVAIPSLLKAWEEVKEAGPQQPPSREAEVGARLSCHLLLKLFQSVDSSFAPLVFNSAGSTGGTGSGSPCQVGGAASGGNGSSGHHQAAKAPSASHSSGIKYSCDRHLLASAHRNIPVGAIIAVLKAILVLGDADSKSSSSSSSIHKLLGGNSASGSSSANFEDDDFGLGLSMGGSHLENSSLSDFAKHTLRQICCQEWVHDRCLQVPDDLLKNGTLLDPMLSTKQAQKLLRFICHPLSEPPVETATSEEDTTDHKKLVTNIMRRLDKWNVRISAVDVRLMFHQSSGPEGNAFLDEAASAIVQLFDVNNAIESKDGGDSEGSDTTVPAATALIPYLVKHLKFLQSRVLKKSGNLLDVGNWSRAPGTVPNGKEASFMHRPFLQLILTCLRELDADCKDKKDRADKEEQKEFLLQSLHTQLSTFLCFTRDEKIYNYADPLARKVMQDALQLRFSLVGGLFETIHRNLSSITDWGTLLVQLIARGVVDLTKNSALFTTALDMLTVLIHSTLVSDRDTSGGGSGSSGGGGSGGSSSQNSGGGGDESRGSSSSGSGGGRGHGYSALVKKLKKEIGEGQSSASIPYLRQLLPMPKAAEEAIVCDAFGTVTDSKGNKVKGFNSDKKAGFQVSDKQRISPWDILEGQRTAATPPLSWTWFGAIKHERKPLKYEDSFCELKHANDSLEQPKEYYLEPPPLPPEDLEPAQNNKGPGGKEDLHKHPHPHHQQAPHPVTPGTNGMHGGMMSNHNQMHMMPMGRGVAMGHPGNMTHMNNVMPMSGANSTMVNMNMMMRGGRGVMPMRPSMPSMGRGQMMGPIARGAGQMMSQPMYGHAGTAGPPMNNWNYGMQPQQQPQHPQMGYGMQQQAGYAMQQQQQHPMSGMVGPRFPAASNSKQALQNMLRARHPSPNQFANSAGGPQGGSGGGSFLQPRQSFPMRPSMRMYSGGGQANNMGGPSGAGPQQQQQQYSAPQQQQQYFNNGNNQMGMRQQGQYMMRQNSGGGFTQQAQPGTMMANRGGGSGAMGMNMGQGGGFNGGQGNYGGGYRPQMRMPTSNAAMQQNPQLMAQLQRGQQQQQQANMNQRQMNFQQQQSRF